MALTRAIFETLILSRTRAILTEALGTATIPALPDPVTSPNPFLGPAIAAALLDCNKAVADPTNPTDLECAALVGPLVRKAWDCGEYHALSAALNQYTEVSISLGMASASQSDLGSRLQRLVEFKAKQLEKAYGVGTFATSTGTIAVGQIRPYLALPNIPQSQNWPPLGWRGRGYGYGNGW